MEISFCIDNKKELKNFLNESFNIILSRNKIINKKKGRKRHINYNKKIFGITLGLSLIWIGLFITLVSNIISYPIGEIITERSTISLIAISFLWIYWLNTIKKNNKEQLKLLNQRGILTITSDKIKMNYIEREISTTIENITAIIIGKYSVNVVTNNNIVFNVPIIIKDKVINTINKYRNNISIIELK